MRRGELVCIDSSIRGIEAPGCMMYSTLLTCREQNLRSPRLSMSTIHHRSKNSGLDSSWSECCILYLVTAETEHSALRRPTRQFTVEVRSSNRRSSLKPTSIWGDIDLKALAREAEAESATDRSPPSPVHRVEEVAAHETTVANLPAGGNQPAAQNDVSHGLSSVVAGKETDVVLPIQVAGAAEMPAKEVAQPRKSKPRRQAAEKSQAVPAVDAVDGTDVDWRLAENHKLKLLLRQKLLRDNALLRDMLNRG